MKILVFAHHLELGGTQTNAIELAAAVRDRHGHDVALFAVARSGGGPHRPSAAPLHRGADGAQPSVRGHGAHTA